MAYFVEFWTLLNMLDFEQDFYKFVKGQLDKKRGNKQLVENEQLYNEDTVQRNRLLSENIQKVLQNERKKMKISKITKEQHFENKMKDFTQMDTFIDVKFFLKNLNDQQMKKNRKKIPKSIKRSKSHTDKEDLFDYAEIVQKSKKFIENSRHFRSKPKIELYLQADNENSQRTKVIEDGRSTSEKFYTGIDQLIIDINHKTVLSEMDRKYERERKKHRDTMSSEQIIKSFIPLDFGKDEIAIEAGKNFKEQSQKVLQLLERTTKMLYKNKLPQPPNQKLLKQQQEQLKELKQYQPNTIDARSQKQILVKSRSESNDMRFPQVNGKLINPLVRRIVPLQQASHASLPEIQPSSFLSQREDKKFENLHYFKSPQNQSKQDDHHNNSSHQSVSPDIKSQIGEFIQQLDDAKQQFQKLYPSDSQIQKIQNNMSKRMMQIGKIPLESFNYLTKKKVQIPKKFELRGKKNKVLQIL
ncbi:unnamed protein product [Paramecium octaurelia]|uniref:Uncharacterized protein n=1 Tax=Paramecium octaurelia TaxID=43137 RepID=A0A8S1SZH0_PAROT|nr:unnamed protein product [Paramecium octaurelia]